jgi:hypothetical protein
MQKRPRGMRTFACHFVLIFSKTRIKTNAKVKIRKKLHFVLFLFDFEHLLFISFLFVAFASRRRPRGKTRIKTNASFASFAFASEMK